MRLVVAGGKTGPWSDALRSHVLDIPLNAVPTAEVETNDDGKLHVHWSALLPKLVASGACTCVQLTGDTSLAKPIVSIASNGNEATIPGSPSSMYYIRTGADLGDATSVVHAKPQRIDVGAFAGDSARSPVQNGGDNFLLND